MGKMQHQMRRWQRLVRIIFEEGIVDTMKNTLSMCLAGVLTALGMSLSLAVADGWDDLAQMVEDWGGKFCLNAWNEVNSHALFCLLVRKRTLT